MVGHCNSFSWPALLITFLFDHVIGHQFLWVDDGGINLCHDYCLILPSFNTIFSKITVFLKKGIDACGKRLWSIMFKTKTEKAEFCLTYICEDYIMSSRDLPTTTTTRHQFF